MEYLGTDLVDLAVLEPYPGNPKLHDIGALRASVRRNGQFQPLCVRILQDGRRVILSGHGTAEAMTAEGHDRARAEMITCDDGEARRINLAANRIGELAGYEDGLLATSLLALEEDYDGTGYDAGFAEDLLLRTDTLADSAAGFLGGALEGNQDEPGDPGSGEPATGDGYVLISWLVPAEDRDMIREVVARVKTEQGLDTSAQAAAWVFRTAGERVPA